MTGLYPTTNAVPETSSPGPKTTPRRPPPLPQRFREAGYVTVSNGKVFHHRRDTARRSWSEPPWRPKTGGKTFYNDATRGQWMKTNEQTRTLPGGKTAKKVPMWEAGEVARARHPTDGRHRPQNDGGPGPVRPDPGSRSFSPAGSPSRTCRSSPPAETYAAYPLDEIELAAHRALPQPQAGGAAQREGAIRLRADDAGFLPRSRI